MFKFETYVRLMIAAVIIGGAGMANAQESTTTSTGGRPECVSIMDRVASGELTFDNMNSAQRSLYDRCTFNSNEISDCSQIEKKYADAMGKLKTACGTMNAPSSGESGWPLCTKSLEQCEKCKTDDPPGNLQCTNTDVVEEEETPRTPTNGKIYGLKNLNTGSYNMKYCPGKLGAEQKDLEEKLEKSQERVDKLREQIASKEEALASAAGEAATAAAEAEEQIANHQSELAEQLEQTQNEQDTALRTLEKEIEGLEMEILRKDDQISQLRAQRAAAENAYQQAITAIDMNCHASAVTNVTNMQQERLELMRAGKFNRNSFKNMMKQVGVSDRESWQRIARKYYQWCLQSEPTRRSKKAAIEKRDEGLLALQNSENTLKKEKQALMERIDKLKATNGCGPQSGAAIAVATKTGQKAEPQACGIIRSAEARAQRLNEQFAAKKAAAQKKAVAAQQAATQKQMMMGSSLNQLKADLAGEEARMNNYQQYLEYAYVAAGATPKDAQDYLEAKEKYGDYYIAAKQVLLCNNPTTCEQSGPCKEAKAYLTNIGETLMFNTGLETSSGGTTTPASTGTTTTTPATGVQ